MTHRTARTTLRARTILSCIVLVVALLTPTLPGFATTASAVSGTVTDSASHAPIQDVEITISDDDFNIVADTVTDASGNYHITSLPTGTYWIDFWKEGYVYEVAELTYSGTPLTRNIELDALQVVATGTVTDALTDAPIEQAWVYAESRTGSDFFGFAETDSAGHYTIYDEAEVGADSLVFYVEASGYEQVESNVTWNGADVLDMDFELEPLFPWTGEVKVVPIEGTDRYETAVQGSQMAFPDADSCNDVVIASGENFPDALGGSALAGALECPVLLTKPTSLSSTTASEIKRLGAKTVWVIGGSAAVSDAVLTSLKNLGMKPQRIAGATRYETASLVAEKTVEVLGPRYWGDVLIATGENFPDALAAAPIAAYAGTPILLVRSDSVPDTTFDALDKIFPARAMVLGGEQAVGASAYGALRAYFGSDGVIRLAGEDRYATASIVAEFGVDEYGLSWGGAGFATGTKFPDALAGGAAQGLVSTVILLTKPTSVPGVVTDTIDSYGDEMNELHFYGGTEAISASVRSKITNHVKAMH